MLPCSFVRGYSQSTGTVSNLDAWVLRFVDCRLTVDAIKLVVDDELLGEIGERRSCLRRACCCYEVYTSGASFHACNRPSVFIEFWSERNGAVGVNTSQYQSAASTEKKLNLPRKCVEHVRDGAQIHAGGKLSFAIRVVEIQSIGE